MKTKITYWIILIIWTVILLFSCKKEDVVPQPTTNPPVVITNNFVGTWMEDSSCTGPQTNMVYDNSATWSKVSFTNDVAKFYSTTTGNNEDVYTFTVDSLFTMENRYKYKIVGSNLSLTFKCDICSDTTHYFYHKQ